MVDPAEVKEEIESLPTKLRDVLRIEATDRGTVRLFEYESSQERMMELAEVYEPLTDFEYVDVFERTIEKNISSNEYRIKASEMSEDDLEELLGTLTLVWEEREQLDLGHIM